MKGSASTDRTIMARYVLAMENEEKIVVGPPDVFIDHVGRGAAGGAFDPQLVVDLATTFDLFDETGARLEVQVVGGVVTLPPVVPADATPGPLLVARANVILAKAQADFDQRRRDAYDAISLATGAVQQAAEDLAANPAAIPAVVAAADQLAKAITQADPLMQLTGFPIVHGDLPVVLAALTEDFGLTPHVGLPPNQGNEDHMELHDQGRAH